MVALLAAGELDGQGEDEVQDGIAVELAPLAPLVAAGEDGAARGAGGARRRR